MATNKVVYSGRTLIDLTDDTITEEALLRGYTAHKADGTQIVGTAFAEQPERQSFLDPLQDSNGEKILDNSNNVLQGETVYKKVQKCRLLLEYSYTFDKRMAKNQGFLFPSRKQQKKVNSKIGAKNLDFMGLFKSQFGLGSSFCIGKTHVSHT